MIQFPDLFDTDSDPIPSGIFFESLVLNFNLPNADAVATWLTQCVATEGYILKYIQYIFCDDAYLLQINTLTDIITFPYNEDPIESDIYISLQRVEYNAQHFAVTFEQELLRVIVHGALHLCGYTDKTPTQKKKMQEREDHYLKLF